MTTLTPDSDVAFQLLILAIKKMSSQSNIVEFLKMEMPHGEPIGKYIGRLARSPPSAVQSMASKLRTVFGDCAKKELADRQPKKTQQKRKLSNQIVPKQAKAPKIVTPDTAYISDCVTVESEARAVSFLQEVSEDRWGGQSGPNKNSLYATKTKQRFHYSYPAKIPEELLAIGREALAAVRSKGVPAPEEFGLDTVVINRYSPGQKCGSHRDNPRKDPFVLGVTLGSRPETSRKMRFRKVSNHLIRHDIQTAARSAYCFWGKAYTDWKHESVASKRQVGIVYSLTFRSKRLDF